MIRNKSFINFINAISIATVLLVTITGRTIPVSALAQQIETIEPIYETDIIALKDYVEQNLDNPQLDIFFLLGGALAVAQLGAQDAMLESPYPNEQSIKEWLINVGLQLYNSVIGLVPSGDYFTNIPIIGQPETAIKGIPRSVIKALVAQLMGDAVVARNYDSVDDYLNDNNRPTVPLNRDAQISINAIWQLQGGPYHWQFNTLPFTSNKVWQSSNIPATSNYWTLLSQLSEPHIRYNPSWSDDATYWSNGYLSSSYFQTYTNLFLNTSNGRYYFMDDSGNIFPSSYISFNEVYYSNGFGNLRSNSSRAAGNDSFPLYYPNADTYVESVRQIYNATFTVFTATFDVFIEDFIKHVYIGTNWINKQEIFNIQDLNISEDMDPYYKSTETMIVGGLTI